MSDPGLSEDQIVQILAFALIAAHVGALIWFWFRRQMAPVLALNLLVSGIVTAYWVPRVGELFHYVDEVAAFVAFEFAVFLMSLAAVFVVRVPRALIWVAFAVNLILLAGAIYFIMTFKIDRLI